MGNVLRQIPPWLSRQQRGHWISLLAIVPLWLACSAAGYLAEARAPDLDGRVVSVEKAVAQRGGALLRIRYVYRDGQGVEHEEHRDLVPRAAQGLGLTAPGVPLKVRLVFGEPLIQGAPNVYFGFPLALAAVFAVLAAIFLAIDRSEARRIQLVLRGKLAPGVIESFAIATVKHMDTWILRFAFEGPKGLQRGQQRIAAAQPEGALVALGLSRTPGAGDPISVAYDPDAPRRCTIYSFEALQDPLAAAPHLKTQPQPLPSPRALPMELLATPRGLPPGAPSLTTEVPLGALLLLLGGALLFGAGPVVFAALTTQPGQGAEALMVGEMMFLMLLAFSVPLYHAAVVQTRATLRDGEPLSAVVTHVAAGEDGKAARVWISFAAKTGEGLLRGRASLRRERLGRMGAAPRAGDTIFLVANRARPWERVIWGFAGDRR